MINRVQGAFCSALLAGSLLLSQGICALQVDNAASHIRFISVKKGSIAEVSNFRRFAGEVGEAGQFTLTIDLSSVDTAIAIRDQRMRDELFDVQSFPSATVTGTLSLADIVDLKAGQEMVTPIDGTLSIHGVKQGVKAQLLVTRLAGGNLRVATVDPIMLSMDALGLSGGVQKLQELAGLPSINRVVPVYFSLVLR